MRSGVVDNGGYLGVAWARGSGAIDTPHQTSACDDSASPARTSPGSRAAQRDDGHFHAMLARETTSDNRKSRASLGDGNGSLRGERQWQVKK